MKTLLLVTIILFTRAIGICQPDMTLWITPDGYHSNHDHTNSQEYFCNSNYYIFYHENPDSLFITIKNSGTETLLLNSINTNEFNGSSFEVVGFTNQSIAPGEMYTVKLLYQLPSEYFNGINGSISFQSNDPENPECILFFDVGCFVEWNFRVNPFAGVDGTCSAPIVWADESNHIGSPSMMFDDSLTFFAYNSNPDTAFRIMKIIEQGVIMQKDVLAVDRFFAGFTGNASENVFNVDTFGVNVNRYLDVNAKMHVAGVLDADYGISCTGALNVTGDTNLDGPVDVSGNAKVHGTLEVDIMTSPSDQRLKKNIVPIAESLNTLMMLSPKAYLLKDENISTHRQFGFLAQELESFIPEIVHQNDEGIKSVNYLQIIPWLTAALQEQQDIIRKLEERIAALESR